MVSFMSFLVIAQDAPNLIVSAPIVVSAKLNNGCSDRK